MEVADTDENKRNRDICSNCKGELSAKDKRVGMPICAKCINEIIDIAKNNISKRGIEKFSNDVDNFTKFISSSSMLMKLDYIVVVQACFNIFMNTLRDVNKIDLTCKHQILRDSKRFIELEIKNTEIEKERKKKIDGIEEEVETREKDMLDLLIDGLDRIIDRYDVKKDASREDNIEDKIEDNDRDIESRGGEILKGSKRIKVN